MIQNILYHFYPPLCHLWGSFYSLCPTFLMEEFLCYKVLPVLSLFWMLTFFQVIGGKYSVSIWWIHFGLVIILSTVQKLSWISDHWFIFVLVFLANVIESWKIPWESMLYIMSESLKCASNLLTWLFPRKWLGVVDN